MFLPPPSDGQCIEDAPCVPHALDTLMASNIIIFGAPVPSSCARRTYRIQVRLEDLLSFDSLHHSEGEGKSLNWLGVARVPDTAESEGVALHRT